jgi:hypothetical protein
MVQEGILGNVSMQNSPGRIRMEKTFQAEGVSCERTKRLYVAHCPHTT